MAARNRSVAVSFDSTGRYRIRDPAGASGRQRERIPEPAGVNLLLGGIKEDERGRYYTEMKGMRRAPCGATSRSHAIMMEKAGTGGALFEICTVISWG
jgi:hypothetical protein